MHSTVTTTITTQIDLDTFTPTHSVHVDAEDELPREVVMAAVEGGLKATLKTVESKGRP